MACRLHCPRKGKPVVRPGRKAKGRGRLRTVAEAWLPKGWLNGCRCASAGERLTNHFGSRRATTAARRGPCGLRCDGEVWLSVVVGSGGCSAGHRSFTTGRCIPPESLYLSFCI